MIGKGNDCLQPIYLPVVGEKNVFLRVRCGHCIACRKKSAMDWSVRLVCESHYWDDISHLTLTYNSDSIHELLIDKEVFSDENTKGIPFDGAFFHLSDLFYRDLQLFNKRFRCLLSRRGWNHAYQDRYYDFAAHRWCERTSITPYRYYSCGEYGELNTRRSHFHLMLFGVPCTKEFEELILRCWGKGNIMLRPFFPETAKYLAGYVQKKLHSDRVIDNIRVPMKSLKSNRLGVRWLFDNMSQVHIDDDGAYIPYQGLKYPIPRYFREILVDMGLLRSTSQLELAVKQRGEYQDLCKFLHAQNVSPDDFFRQRRDNFEQMLNRMTSRRNRIILED